MSERLSFFVPPMNQSPEDLARAVLRDGSPPKVRLYAGDCRSVLADMDTEERAFGVDRSALLS